MKNKIWFLALILAFTWQRCGVYSMSGSSTAAKTLSIDQFFNNTDLGPANLGARFTNAMKDYFQQNSSLRVIAENAELHFEGVLSDYRINPMAPVSTGNVQDPNKAAISRLTITVKVTFEDTLEPVNSFKDRIFSFYADFDNTLVFTNEQERLEKKIFDQIMLDIFNATVANW